VESGAGRSPGRSIPALVLASASPQRSAILERLGLRFTVRPSGASELDGSGAVGEPLDAGALVCENALRKLRAARRPDASEVVLACDTVVALDGLIYGKPEDERAAAQTLRALSGSTHEVFSAVALSLEGEERTAIARTAVSFRALDSDLLEWYVRRGEWRERAGGYAIQGAGAALVRELHGDYENVVGLPLATLLELYPELFRHR
jgi:septum formation protein